ncbi:SpoIID/LytB domain-containing protein [Tumebacillus permanentifrigoris]|uniref:SpoIID/LytB domain protein n=1 Tax=Tumebacillus permanentifrigoris TaxID=378543 RepID=A0A316DBP8_9BACL|nr:SpoIID/LytB domain-containing protein [Tumebacillus permanentifrigoris]PWK15621.1 SpoIID/LytB domain protein [Tumebacillus permanentifrigoris]
MTKGMKILTVFLMMFALLFPSNGAWAANDNKVMDSIEHALVVSAILEGPSWYYTVITGGQAMSYYTENKSFVATPGQYVNFKAKDGRIVDFRGEAVTAPYYHEKIMAKDTAKRVIDLELHGSIQLASSYAVFRLVEGGQTVPQSLKDIAVGVENVSVFYDEQEKATVLLLEGKTPVQTMRVGINNSGFASLDHSRLDFASAGGLQVVDKKANWSYDVASNTTVALVPGVDGTHVSVAGQDLYTSPNRLYVYPADVAMPVQIMTFKRAYGYPLYRGFFEITPAATAGKLALVNEVQIEDYLRQVVPSEMPASFGLEALKAQSVAARTYALGDYESNRYATKGFHVDDSTLSQVYNNSAENALTSQAVSETSGLVMKSGDALVDARYYSTSGGYGAAKHEVWADGNGAFPGVPIGYLNAKSYVYDPNAAGELLNLNTQDEAALNAFYKDLSLKGYDSESYYFRWKVAFSRTELENTINKNLAGRYQADPTAILTQDASGQFVSKPIPATGVGTVRNLSVSKRGAGGNMMELVVETSTGTYKIVKEYNIRFTVRPSNLYTGGKDVLLSRAKGGATAYDPNFVLKNYTILPSAFATFDLARDAAGNLTSVTFFGGGNGHGVGMSQYGASSLGLSGWSYDRILNAYYSGMSLVNVYEM